jgi:PDZ domain
MIQASNNMLAHRDSTFSSRRRGRGEHSSAGTRVRPSAMTMGFDNAEHYANAVSWAVAHPFDIDEESFISRQISPVIQQSRFKHRRDEDCDDNGSIVGSSDDDHESNDGRLGDIEHYSSPYEENDDDVLIEPYREMDDFDVDEYVSAEANPVFESDEFERIPAEISLVVTVGPGGRARCGTWGSASSDSIVGGIPPEPASPSSLDEEVPSYLYTCADTVVSTSPDKNHRPAFIYVRLRKTSREEICGITVKTLTKDGPGGSKIRDGIEITSISAHGLLGQMTSAGIDHLVRPGDRIISINGVTTVNIHATAVAKRLREVDQNNEVSLIVHNPDGDGRFVATTVPKPNPQSSAGIRVRGGGAHTGRSLHVSRVDDEGLFANTLLQVGQRCRAVNGISAHHLGAQGGARLITNATRFVTIVSEHASPGTAHQALVVGASGTSYGNTESELQSSSRRRFLGHLCRRQVARSRSSSQQSEMVGDLSSEEHGCVPVAVATLVSPLSNE